MQEKLELLADRVRALIQEVNDLREQNAQLQALLTQKENEAICAPAPSLCKAKCKKFTNRVRFFRLIRLQCSPRCASLMKI